MQSCASAHLGREGDVRGRPLAINHALARHLSEAHPGRFSVMCESLRRHPLPVTAGSAVTVLAGGSREAAVAALQFFEKASLGGQSPGGHPGKRPAGPLLFRVLVSSAAQQACSSSPSAAPPAGHLVHREQVKSQSGGPSASAAQGKRRRGLDAATDPRVVGAEAVARAIDDSCAETDALLEMLGVLTPRSVGCGLSSPVAGEELGQSHAEATATHSAKRPRGEDAVGPGAEMLDGLTVRELKDRCSDCGLLTTGKKSDLIRRLVRAAAVASPVATDALKPAGTGSTLPPSTVSRALNREPPRLSVRGYVAAQRQRVGLAGAPDTPPTSREVGASWRLLIDCRERRHASHENLLAECVKAGISCASSSLPCGDFVFGLESSAPATEAAAVAVAPGGPRELELFPVVVERKTVQDLCASIVGTRYHHQRQVLALSPFRVVLYVVEGTTRHMSASERQRVLSACATLSTPLPHLLERKNLSGIGGGGAAPIGILPHLELVAASWKWKKYAVCRTRSFDETVRLLKRLGQVLADDAAARRAPLATSAAMALQATAPMARVFSVVERLQRRIRAETALPRMLMCVHGCSDSLALALAAKYKTMLALWREVRARGDDVDLDHEIQQLSKPQRKVFILLTEFLRAESYL